MVLAGVPSWRWVMSSGEQVQALFYYLGAQPIFWVFVIVAAAFALGATVFGGRR